MVSGLDRAEDVDGRDIRTSEGAIMHHLFDARASGSDLRCQIGEPARSIANNGGKSAKTAVCYQTTLYYTTEHVGIDVAAAK
jgi:hypothetical protein